MKGAVYESFGDPAVLSLAEVEPPAPKQGHLLVDVHYAGVNPVDWKIRRGYFKDVMPHEFPIVSGFDFAGVVSEVGAGGRRIRARRPGVLGQPRRYHPLRQLCRDHYRPRRHHGACPRFTVAPRCSGAALGVADGMAVPVRLWPPRPRCDGPSSRPAPAASAAWPSSSPSMSGPRSTPPAVAPTPTTCAGSAPTT